ncbi:hypothetical protein EPD60_09660 [Flaviaesturariibacter flavus]|uniref:Uncharacterized protein n=1 Tax=Flaviaesturariibacter flavus TaxID=2502780 RepID=A0A4R1BBA2_9BACT|nr:hypothetical protein [Flaviaesturariibacter flavus]TCJ14259.1 hypothetical protein EPD60_09660 [Flaviaesturariibacter flavus]
MTEELNQPQQQPEPRRRRHSSRSRHSGRSGSSGRRRSSSSRSSSKSKITFGQVLLLVWSVVSMFAFIYLLEDEQQAPLGIAVLLGLATLVGLLLFFRTIPKKK